ncbi:hypothetical protein MTR_3g031980 [Medicago truncatula]|uniref:Uncharacterized protein n=1 Tax=Medicago truncatula TaxID=3880 RepID=G7IWY5_MEDTR|nr:hypothetical protein MTR_3g031980 [Medicago truncatula]
MAIQSWLIGKDFISSKCSFWDRKNSYKPCKRLSDRRNGKAIINSHTQVKVPEFEPRSWHPKWISNEESDERINIRCEL